MPVWICGCLRWVSGSGGASLSTTLVWTRFLILILILIVLVIIIIWAGGSKIKITIKIKSGAVA